jgi:hypothetical protein
VSARNCSFEGGNGVRFSVPTSTVIGAKQHRVADDFRNPAKTGYWGKGDVHCNRSTHAECGRQGKQPAGWAVQGRLPVVNTGRMNPSGGLMPVRPRRWAVRSGRGSRCRLEVGGTSGEARLCSTDQGPSVHQRLAYTERFRWEERDGVADSFARRGESEARADGRPMVETRIERTTKLLRKKT